LVRFRSFFLVLLFAITSNTTFAEEIPQIRSIFPLLERTPEDKFVIGEGRSYAMAWNSWVWNNFKDPIPVEMLPEAARSGGTTTSYIQNREAFSIPLANLDASLVRTFAFARHLFRKRWAVGHSLENRTVTSVGITEGLGPTFNRSSCSGCHLKDGRGHPPRNPGEPMKAMIIRLSIPGIGINGGPLPHPKYGTQLQDNSIQAIPKEGRVTIRYKEIEGFFADGKPYSLRTPIYEFSEMSYGPVDEDLLFSPRVAPAMYGLGLLEAIPQSIIQAQSDPHDIDGDGISGRPNWVWDPVAQKRVLGRFGWKANVANLHQQVASAAVGDIGITTSVFPSQNCLPAQTACLSAPQDSSPELDDIRLSRLVLYSRSLAVPAKRNFDKPEVRKGQRLFVESGCAGCHTPNTKTSPAAVMPAIASQDIHPYTDLLLHDMGEGLADGRPDFEATGQEWRTPPLWGIGLVHHVNLHRFFLHDGRARGMVEAILWHGGEAQNSQNIFLAMAADDRAALLAFLKSL
jgi:CxxC motif-containing protein (DUF1111 family)